MISFSGIDCSGKSTQIELLTKNLRLRGIKCQVVWSRGGYTPGIEFLKKIIRRGKTESSEKHIVQSNRINQNIIKRKILFYIGLIDLLIYYSVVLRIKDLFLGCLICDRYIWDTYIDYKIKYPEYCIEEIFLWKLIVKTCLKPQKSICLFISPEESMRRSNLKYEPFPENIEERKKRIKMYQIELSNNRWNTIIDASDSIEEVFRVIIEAVNGDK